MKKLLISLLMISSLTSFAGIFRDASLTELNILTTYLADAYGGESTLSNSLDEDSISTRTFSYQGKKYKVIIVYSGDTAHGPVYDVKTLKIVGEMGDGDIIINGSYIDL